MADISKKVPAVKSGTSVSTVTQTSSANGASYVQADINKIVTDQTNLITQFNALVNALSQNN